MAQSLNLAIAAQRASLATIEANAKEEHARQVELQENVAQILAGVELVSQGNSGHRLMLQSDDAIGQLAVGLNRFFVEKEQVAQREQENQLRKKSVRERDYNLSVNSKRKWINSSQRLPKQHKGI